jgi:formamidopyrimidine-DNA glycosylase
MPEGPEVKVVAEWLNTILSGKKINFKSGGYLIRNSQIISIVAKGKIILLTFLDKPHLLVHFGLFGNLKIMKSEPNQNSVFAFKNGKKCGEMLITMESEELYGNKLILGFCSGTGASFKWVTNQFDELDKIGPDAMSESVDSLMKEILQKASKRKSIDSILTDQKIISGIGKRWRLQLFDVYHQDSTTKLEKIKDLKQLLETCINIGQSMYTEFSNHFLPVVNQFTNSL